MVSGLQSDIIIALVTIPVFTGLALFLNSQKSENHAFLRIFEQTNLPLLVLSSTGTIIDGNLSWREFAGLDGREFEELKKTYDVFHDPYLQSMKLIPLLREAFINGESVQSEPFLWNPKNDPHAKKMWIFLGLRPLRDTKGQVREVVLRFIDVTLKHEAELAAKTANQMLKVVVDNCPAVIFLKDLDGRYLLVNEQWQNALTIKRDDVLGRTDHDVFSQELADQFTDADNHVRLTGQVTSREEIAPHADGLHTYYSTKFPIRDADGTLRAIGGIATDISELKKAQAERADLEVREKTALEASVMKSIFLANMSHELRTPINGVMGMADLLRSTQLSSDQNNMTDHILHSAESLLVLVNDILDLSKAEAGKIEVELVNLDLEHTLGDVEKTLRITADKKGLHLGFAVDPNLPRMLRGDPTRVRQVLMNLVSNALKFTEEGGVGVRVFAGQARNGVATIRFQVNDTGIGIAPETIPKLFMSFSQADASTTRKFGGSGLGLSISKHLVQLMGGEIGVQRRDEGGMQFWFDLPLVRAEAAPAHISPQPAIEATLTRSLKILVAEDNPTNQIIATRMLHRLGHTTVLANNGRDALKKLEAQKFDLILMDCQMPDVDGYETARTIRSGKAVQTDADIPIIALTANAMRGDREKCLEAGMTDYVSKPVRLVDIEKAITRVVSARAKAA